MFLFFSCFCHCSIFILNFFILIFCPRKKHLSRHTPEKFQSDIIVYFSCTPSVFLLINCNWKTFPRKMVDMAKFAAVEATRQHLSMLQHKSPCAAPASLIHNLPMSASGSPKLLSAAEQPWKNHSRHQAKRVQPFLYFIQSDESFNKVCSTTI